MKIIEKHWQRTCKCSALKFRLNCVQILLNIRMESFFFFLISHTLYELKNFSAIVYLTGMVKDKCRKFHWNFVAIQRLFTIDIQILNNKLLSQLPVCYQQAMSIGKHSIFFLLWLLWWKWGEKKTWWLPQYRQVRLVHNITLILIRPNDVIALHVPWLSYVYTIYRMIVYARLYSFVCDR